jgi:hypothetical protein
LRIQEVYGTDTVVYFAGYPVLRRAPRYIAHNVTALTDEVDDFSYDEVDDFIYDEEDEPTNYDLPYVVSDRISTCSQ